MKIILKKISGAILGYLSDWKNLAVHAIAGVVLVLVLFIVPLPLYVRIIIFIAVIIFNGVRGQLKKKKTT